MKEIKKILDRNIQKINWPEDYLDVYPIEHVWRNINRAISLRKHFF